MSQAHIIAQWIFVGITSKHGLRIGVENLVKTQNYLLLWKNKHTILVYGKNNSTKVKKQAGNWKRFEAPPTKTDWVVSELLSLISMRRNHVSITSEENERRHQKVIHRRTSKHANRQGVVGNTFSPRGNQTNAN